MREIKFRGWERDLKVMVYSNELCGYTEYSCNPVRALNIILNEDDDGYDYMEYTGLTDKNGREIYEGDIFHMGDPQITYTVVWHDTGLIGKENGASSFVGLSHWKSRIEVIGNIYEGVE